MEIFINSGEHTVPLLEVKRLTKHFGGLSAITELNLDVMDSEILGIIGPNGAGKSTLFNLICGFYRPTQGTVTFEGKDITGLSAHRIAQLGIGRSFQASTLFLKLTVFDNVFIGFNMAYKEGVWKSFLHTPSALREERIVKEKVCEILEFMGMADLKDQIAHNLPHGHQRILGVCIALATRPRLLLLDEPLTGMHPEETARMLDLIRKLQERDITIVLVEHNMDAVMQLCDRIVVLNYGRKLAEGFPNEVRENREVIAAYLGAEEGD
jgi:branched-chain amino acid transport system ATP-binding protein